MAATKTLLQSSAEDRRELRPPRFLVGDYHRMIDFRGLVYKRGELLDGVVGGKKGYKPPPNSSGCPPICIPREIPPPPLIGGSPPDSHPGKPPARRLDHELTVANHAQNERARAGPGDRPRARGAL